MKNIAHEILLLMINLSQMREQENLVHVFTEAINSYSPDFQINFERTQPAEDVEYHPVKTIQHNFGFITLRGNPVEVSENFPQLFFNSVQMLSVILEKLMLEEQMSKENIKLENLVKSKGKSLFESEEIKRTLTEFSSDHILLLDLSGRIKYINRTHSGKPAEEVIGKLTTDFLPESSKLLAEDCYRKVIETKSTHSYIAEYEESPGKIKFFNTRVAPILNEAGEVYALISSSNDISTRVRQNKMLAESEEKFRTMFQNASDGILIGNEKGEIIEANDTFLEFSGYEADDIIGRPIRILFAPGMLAKKPLRFYDLNEGKNVISERSILKKDGSSVPIEMHSKKLHTNHYLSIIRDLSERNSAEAALRESEEKFRVLAESTSSAIFIYKGPKFAYANHATERLTGYVKKELVNMNFWDVVHEEDRQLVRERGEARQRGEPVPKNYQFRIVTKEGFERWIDFSAGRINYGGENAGLGTAYDITPWKEAEAELKEHKKNLEKIIDARMKEIADKNEKLSFINKQFIGREFRIKELNERVRELEALLSNKQ